MSSGLLLFVGAIYLWVGYDHAQSGKHGLALAWTAYAAANVGFAWDAWR